MKNGVYFLKIAAKQLGPKKGPAEETTDAELETENKRTEAGSKKVSWGDREKHEDEDDDDD